MLFDYSSPCKNVFWAAECMLAVVMPPLVTYVWLLRNFGDRFSRRFRTCRELVFLLFLNVFSNISFKVSKVGQDVYLLVNLLTIAAMWKSPHPPS